MSEHRMTSLMEKFTSMHVLVIGDVMIDAYIWGNHTRMSPEAPVPVVDVQRREAKLGGAANVALNLKALGARATILSVLGGQGRSQEFIQLMKDAELETKGVLVDDNRICTVKTRVISNEKHMMRVDEEQSDYISEAKEESILGSLSMYLRQQKVDAVVLQDYNKGVLTPRVIKEAIAQCRELNVPVTVDPKKDNFMDYGGVSLFKPNKKELEGGLDMTIDASSRESIQKAFATLAQKMPHKATLLTLSEHGVAYFSDQEFDVMPVFERNIIDVSGAGDTVIAVASLAMAAGALLPDVASISNLAGGMACEYVGVQAVDREALMQEALSLS